jgi:hypothetical protein
MWLWILAAIVVALIIWAIVGGMNQETPRMGSSLPALVPTAMLSTAVTPPRVALS